MNRWLKIKRAPRDPGLKPRALVVIYMVFHFSTLILAVAFYLKAIDSILQVPVLPILFAGSFINTCLRIILSFYNLGDADRIRQVLLGGMLSVMLYRWIRGPPLDVFDILIPLAA